MAFRTASGLLWRSWRTVSSDEFFCLVAKRNHVLHAFNPDGALRDFRLQVLAIWNAGPQGLGLQEMFARFIQSIQPSFGNRENVLHEWKPVVEQQGRFGAGDSVVKTLHSQLRQRT